MVHQVFSGFVLYSVFGPTCPISQLVGFNSISSTVLVVAVIVIVPVPLPSANTSKEGIKARITAKAMLAIRVLIFPANLLKTCS